MARNVPAFAYQSPGSIPLVVSPAVTVTSMIITSSIDMEMYREQAEVYNCDHREEIEKEFI
jgi:hypothetical protein